MLTTASRKHKEWVSSWESMWKGEGLEGTLLTKSFKRKGKGEGSHEGDWEEAERSGGEAGERTVPGAEREDSSKKRAVIGVGSCGEISRGARKCTWN